MSMSENTPIVLCHAACSGGSMIYRLMVSTFGFQGIAEISHGRRGAFAFSPVDPEAQMFALGQLDHKEFGEVLARRLFNVNKLAIQSGKQLLIREHTHNYFFNNDCAEVMPTSPSWVADQFGNELSDIPIVVTTRDPIDSWLGFRQNFNHLKPDRFEDYCAKYNEFIDRVENWQSRGESIHVFKYEDCVVSPETMMRELADFLNLKFVGLDTSAAFKTASSGNSGRQSATLAPRKRRPFTMKLLNAARSSSEYNTLCSRLGYDTIYDNLSVSDRFSARFHSLTLPLRQAGNLAEGPGRWIHKMLKSGRGIQ